MPPLLNQILSDESTGVDTDDDRCAYCNSNFCVCRYSLKDLYLYFLYIHDCMDWNEAVSTLGMPDDWEEKAKRILRVFHRALLHHAGIKEIQAENDDRAELKMDIGAVYRIINKLQFCSEQKYKWADLVGKVLCWKVNGPGACAI